MGNCTQCTVSGFGNLPGEPTLHITSLLSFLSSTTLPNGVPKVGLDWTIYELKFDTCGVKLLSFGIKHFLLFRTLVESLGVS